MKLLRRNMTAGVLHGTFFQMASAFAEPFVLLPLFLKEFTSSTILIGLIVSFLQSGRALPQLWASRILRRHPDSGRRMMLISVWTRWLIWGTLATTVWSASDATPRLLAVIIPLLALYAVAGGVANIPINQVIAETIPPQNRSSFFGLRLLFGGLLAMAAGYGVRTVLAVEGLEWPRNYGILFLFSFLALALAYSSISFVRFPRHISAGTSEDITPPIHDEIRSILRVYPIMWRLIGVQLLAGGLSVALPFLTLYGKEILGFPLEWVGIVIVAQTVGAVFGNLLWMPLGDRHGTRVVILSGMCGALASLCYIGLVETPLLFAVGFGFLGFSSSGMLVGFNGYVLELGTEEERSLLVGIQETLLFPLYFMPLLGGIFVKLCGYRSLLITAFALIAPAILFAWRLCEPRSENRRCGPREVKLAGIVRNEP